MKKLFLLSTLFLLLSIFFVSDISKAEGIDKPQQDLSLSTYQKLIDEGILGKDVTYEVWVEINSESRNENAAHSSDNSQLASVTLRKGDVLISNGTTSFGLSGHAGIALGSNSVLSIAGSGHYPVVYTLDSWKKRYGKSKGDGWTNTEVYRVDNKYASIAYAAADWAIANYKGKKYSYGITTGIYSKDPTYCSKIVWQAYYYGSGSHPVMKIPNTRIATPYSLPTYFNAPYNVRLYGTI